MKCQSEIKDVRYSREWIVKGSKVDEAKEKRLGKNYIWKQKKRKNN